MITKETPLVEISHLSFSFGEKIIFDDICLTVPKGKVVAILGPSGTGKTTLLRMIGAQLVPDNGHIYYQGQDIHKKSRKELFKLRQHMGLLFQSGALFTNLNVFENVAFPLRENTKLPEEVIRTIVLMKLEVVGLRGAQNLMPAQISGGMARRVSLARALATDPSLMMYDEPFAGLDPISKAAIVKLIKEINQTLETTSILVSHDVPETLSLADYVYMISGGKIIASGMPEELKHSSQEAVKQFMHGLADGSVPFHYPAQNYMQELMG